MIWRLILIGMVLNFLQTNAQAKGASNQFDKNAIFTIDQTELIHRAINNVPNETIISMAFINGNEVKYLGIKRENDTLKAIDTKDLAFEIGSLTKNFTALLLAELVVNQTVDLNEELSNIFDFSLKTKEKITLNHLASHSSGLKRLPDNMKDLFTDNPYKNYSKEDLKYYLTENLTLNQTPGQKWDYSNLGYGVLGFALEQKTKQSLQNLYDLHLLKKNQMNQTFLDRKNLTVKQVQGLDNKGKPTSNWDFDSMAAIGGLKSTTQDMVKFIKLHLEVDNPAIKMVLKERIEMNEEVSSTLSWLYIKQKNIFINNGGTGGFSSSMSFNADKKKGVVILTNLSAFSQYGQIIETLNIELLNKI